MTHEDNFDQFLSERTQDELKMLWTYTDLRDRYIEESGINEQKKVVMCTEVK